MVTGVIDHQRISGKIPRKKFSRPVYYPNEVAVSGTEVQYFPIFPGAQKLIQIPPLCGDSGGAFFHDPRYYEGPHRPALYDINGRVDTQNYFLFGRHPW